LRECAGGEQACGQGGRGLDSGGVHRLSPEAVLVVVFDDSVEVQRETATVGIHNNNAKKAGSGILNCRPEMIGKTCLF
jgi:hypothetical protein